MVATAGCGRIGFDLNAMSDALEVDAPPGAMTTVSSGSAASDTYIVTASSSQNNYGAAASMQVNGAPATHALLRFDLSAIPTSATVFSSKLHLAVEQTNSTNTAFNAFRVLEAWDEGTGNGQVGAASWSLRQVGVPWTNAGALGPTSSVTNNFSSWIASAGAGVYVLSLNPTIVQAWVSDPTTNFGFEIRSSTFMSFSSRESTDPPTLTVVWLP